MPVTCSTCSFAYGIKYAKKFRDLSNNELTTHLYPPAFSQTAQRSGTTWGTWWRAPEAAPWVWGSREGKRRSAWARWPWTGTSGRPAGWTWAAARPYRPCLWRTGLARDLWMGGYKQVNKGCMLYKICELVMSVMCEMMITVLAIIMWI